MSKKDNGRRAEWKRRIGFKWPRKGVAKEFTFPLEEELIDVDTIERVRGCIKSVEADARVEGSRCAVIGRADGLQVYACRYTPAFFALLPLYLQAASWLFLARGGFVAYRPMYGAIATIGLAASPESLAKPTRYVKLPVVRDAFWFSDFIYVITQDPRYIEWLFQIKETSYAPRELVGRVPAKLVTAYLEFYGYEKLPDLVRILAREVHSYGSK